MKLKVMVSTVVGATQFSKPFEPINDVFLVLKPKFINSNNDYLYKI